MLVEYKKHDIKTVFEILWAIERMDYSFWKDVRKIKK